MLADRVKAVDKLMVHAAPALSPVMILFVPVHVVSQLNTGFGLNRIQVGISVSYEYSVKKAMLMLVKV